MIRFMAKMTKEGKIVLPKKLLEIKGYEIGSTILMRIFKTHIELRPLKPKCL